MPPYVVAALAAALTTSGLLKDAIELIHGDENDDSTPDS
jgi:hypothetical protein